MEKRYPIPPFTMETALQKVQAAEDAWNTKDPEKVVLAYSTDTEWRNRTEFLNGRDEVKAFLYRKWEKEQGYKLKKELWEFDENGYMRKRFASINDMPINEQDRKL